MSGSRSERDVIALLQAARGRDGDRLRFRRATFRCNSSYFTMYPHPDSRIITARCAVLTVSDTRTIATDRSGQLLQRLLDQAHHTVAAYAICPDDPAQIRRHLEQWGQDPVIDLVITSGGTGIAPRDTTYEAIAALLHPTLPGFGELFRMLSFSEIGSRAMASRAIAGVYCQTWVFALPGSSNGVQLAMERLILPELTHLLTQLRPDFPAAPTVPPP